MTDTLEQISGLLHEAGETHHRVFRIVDGADDDWASWYAQWLIDLSELPDLLGVRPVRSELIYLNSRELHQTGEKPQVAMSGGTPPGFRGFSAWLPDQVICQSDPVRCKICP